MGSVSHWQAEAERLAPATPRALDGDQTADVAVIGAGITGTALALDLARAGVNVAVVEARQVAAGASGRNGGFLLGGTAETYRESIARYGHETARRIWGFSVANHERAAGLIAELAELGWDCGYQRTGSLRIAMAEGEWDAIRASVDQLRADGWAAELVERAALPPVLRSSYLGASFHPLDGEIQPARFVRGLALLATHAGATLYEESPVTALDVGADGVRVGTGRGTLRAERIVLATNAWLPQLGTPLGAGWLSGVIMPVRGQVLSTAPVAERLFDCPCYGDEGYQYWRQLPDGRLVVGGWRNRSVETEYTSDETPGATVQPHLEAFVRETLGQRDVAIEHRWAGIMAFSADGLPLVGALPGHDRVYLAGGYTGHGNAYAISCAAVLSALVRGETHPDADLFTPTRFEVGAARTGEAQSQ